MATSSDYAYPASSALERDARLTSTDHDHKVEPGDIAVGVVIGRTTEFFSFFVFGLASVLAFPHVMFPFADRLWGTVYAFAVFSLAFVGRPIGSVTFMAIDRRYGRGVKLTIAMFLLAGSTAIISFLPGYASFGLWSIVLLAMCRFVQGVALGGAWDGLASLLALNAPQNRRGWFAMMPQLGAPLGFMLASALFAFFVANLTPDDFLDWGWRYPFFMSFTLNVVALFARLRLVATDEFQNLYETRDLRPTPVTEMLSHHWRNVLVGALVPLASFAMFHLVTVFPLGWIQIYTDRSPAEFLMIQFGGAFLAMILVCAAGMLADKIGRRRTLGIGAFLILLFSLSSIFAPLLDIAGELGQTLYIVVGFGLVGMTFSQAAGSLASNFPTKYRYTGAALTSDLSWLLGAGFAPLVALGLASYFGLYAVGFYLLSGALATLGALWYNKLQS